MSCRCHPRHPLTCSYDLFFGYEGLSRSSRANRRRVASSAAPSAEVASLRCKAPVLQLFDVGVSGHLNRVTARRLITAVANLKQRRERSSSGAVVDAGPLAKKLRIAVTCKHCAPIGWDCRLGGLTSPCQPVGWAGNTEQGAFGVAYQLTRILHC
jgi:hypothetical protein